MASEYQAVPLTLGVAWNKELTQGSGLEANSYGTRAVGDVTKAAWIGNGLRIDQERQELCWGGEEVGLAGL